MVRRKIGAQLNRPFLGFRFVGGDRNAGVLCAGGEEPVATVHDRVRVLVVANRLLRFAQYTWPRTIRRWELISGKVKDRRILWHATTYIYL